MDSPVPSVICVRRLDRIPLAQQVETMLEEAIRSGSFGRELPGYRELGKILGVSRTAIAPALAALVARGILISPGHRRRFRIADDHGSKTLKLKKAKVLLLEANVMGERTPFSDGFVAQLQRLCGPEAWTIEHLVVKADQSRSAPKRWQMLLESSEASALIVIAGHRPTLAWAAACGVPVLAVCGDSSGLSIPTIGFENTALIDAALTRLFETGHRDICLPVGVRSSGFVEEIESAMAHCFKRHGVNFTPRLHCPKWHTNTPDAWVEGLEWRITKQRPDAFVFIDVGPFQTAQGVFMRRGWAVPKDLSLVVMADRSDLLWFRPEPACFQLDPERLAAGAARWLRAPGATRSTPVAKAGWVEGASILDRR